MTVVDKDKEAKYSALVDDIVSKINYLNLQDQRALAEHMAKKFNCYMVPTGEEIIHLGSIYTIADDDFTGEVIGYYTTRNNVRGYVLQQLGTRVIHTYTRRMLGMDP
jgi:hypothetical protein